MKAEEAVQFLEEILRIPSVNGEHDEGKVAEYLHQYFSRHGIESKIDRLDEKRANVIAFVPGREEETVVWNGHLDTVEYGDRQKWQTDPQVPVRQDGRIYARGASDMKSGLAAMVYALTHLPGRPRKNIQFLGTCDEERGGAGAKAVLDKGQMKPAGLILVGEPTGMRLGIAQKGCLWLEIKVKGKTGHGAYPEKGINAIERLYALTEQLKSYVLGFSHPYLGRSTMQINQIAGGMAANMTADDCWAVLDIRMTPPLTAEDILRRAGEILRELQQASPGLSMEFAALNRRRAIQIAPEAEWVQSWEDLLRKKGYAGDKIGINFFTDASILTADSPEQAVLLFGPGEPEMAHQPNEYVEVQKYADAIELLQSFAVL